MSDDASAPRHLCMAATKESTDTYGYHTFDRWVTIDLTGEEVDHNELLRLLREHHKGWTKAYMVYGDIRAYDEDGLFIRLCVPEDNMLPLVEQSIVRLLNASALFNHEWIADPYRNWREMSSSTTHRTA